MKNTIKIISSLFLILLLVTGCKKIPKLENGQEAVVTFEKGNISIDSLYNELKDKYAVSILVDMIDKEILTEKYKTDENETDKINSQIEYMQSQFESTSEYLTAIQNYFGVQTEDELRNVLSLDYKRTLAIDDYLKTAITDKEIEAYYDDKVIGDMEISHILIKPNTTEDMTSEEKNSAEEEALKKAEEIITKLNNGEDFATLAKDNSDDTGSAKDGGSLGWINKTTASWDQDFIEAAIALENNTYSTTPVKSQFGYHIINKTGVKDKAKLSEIKDDIIESLIADKKTADSTISYKALIEIRKNAKVEIQDSELNKQYNQLMDNLLSKQS